MQRIAIHALRLEYRGLIITAYGWVKKPTLNELKGLLANEEALCLKYLSKKKKKLSLPKREDLKPKIGDQRINKITQMVSGAHGSRISGRATIERELARVKEQMAKTNDVNGLQSTRNGETMNATIAVRKGTTQNFVDPYQQKVMLLHPPKKMNENDKDWDV